MFRTNYTNFAIGEKFRNFVVVYNVMEYYVWAQDKHRTLSLSRPPKEWLKNTKCPKFEQ